MNRTSSSRFAKIVASVLIALSLTGCVGNPILNEPAQSHMRASGINSLLAVWGIPLNDGNGPRSLGDVSDDILDYLSANASGSGELTKDDIRTSLQPGNTLNSIVYRLYNSQEAIDAVVDRWLS